LRTVIAIGIALRQSAAQAGRALSEGVLSKILCTVRFGFHHANLGHLNVHGNDRLGSSGINGRC